VRHVHRALMAPDVDRDIEIPFDEVAFHFAHRGGGRSVRCCVWQLASGWVIE
jgi:hypothetical protein